MSNIIDKIQLSGVTYDIGGQGGSGVSVVEVTQAEYDALPSSAKTDTSKMYVITDAQAGDLTQYWTSAQTSSAITQAVSGKVDTTTFNTYSGSVETALSGKQDTLVSGTNIKTINNESLLGSGNIVIQGGGGGKTIEAGRGITVTTGATADTVSFNLPISAGTANMGNITCCGSNTVSGQYAVAFGNGNTTSGGASLTFGRDCSANSYDNVAGGFGVTTRGTQASSFGQYTKTENVAEHSVGRYNASNKANTTWGDSGNTLFSVGNGTSNSARHNAFEIRQNGDIYLTSGSTDIKLQDHLGGGGSITVDSTLIENSTNPVEGGVLYDELIYKGAASETTIEWSGSQSTNYPSGCTEIKVEVSGSNNGMYIDFFDDNWQKFGNVNINNWGSISVVINDLQGATYEISGTTVTISYPSVTGVTKINSSGTVTYTTKAVTYGASTTVKDALGGLKFVKLTQTEYDNLQTKDSNTLYVIVN